MLKCLRRTAVIFRLTNHRGWADREFISGRESSDASIRDEFFRTRDTLGCSNLQLVDGLIAAFTPELRERGSAFAHPDFPAAETWWWNYSALEVSNELILESLARMRDQRSLEPLLAPAG
jgi:hypothetical protein